jgi:hypothetical protein
VTEVYLPPYTVTSAHANSTVFIEFMLKMILQALSEMTHVSEKMSEKMSDKILRLIPAGSEGEELSTICRQLELHSAVDYPVDPALPVILSYYLPIPKR